MQNYKVLQKIGGGTFGTCFQATDNRTGQLVAIKQLRDGDLNSNECKVLKKLNHVNIIKLIEVIQQSKKLVLVLEYVEKNLLSFYVQVRQQNRQINEQQIQSIIYQVASSLAYIHEQGYFHRDLKPENIMISDHGVIKLIDFGQVTSLQSNQQTEYVSTRWYRSPEQLITAPYDQKIDIWALGCIMAELYLLRPIFAGTSEIDQLQRIETTLGALSINWPKGSEMMKKKGAYMPSMMNQSMPNIDTSLDLDSIPEQPRDLLKKMLKMDPEQRINAQQILQHSWLRNKTSYLPQSIIDGEENYIIETPKTIKKADLKHRDQHQRAVSLDDGDDNFLCDYVPSGLNSQQKRQPRRIKPKFVDQTNLTQPSENFESINPYERSSKVQLEIPQIQTVRPWNQTLDKQEIQDKPVVKGTFFSKPVMKKI